MPLRQRGGPPPITHKLIKKKSHRAPQQRQIHSFLSFLRKAEEIEKKLNGICLLLRLALLLHQSMKDFQLIDWSELREKKRNESKSTTHIHSRECWLIAFTFLLFNQLYSLSFLCLLLWAEPLAGAPPITNQLKKRKERDSFVLFHWRSKPSNH